MTRVATAAAAPRGRPTTDRASLYEDITNKIIAELEAGRLPWVQPWGSAGVRASLAMPKNVATGRAYSGSTSSSFGTPSLNTGSRPRAGSPSAGHFPLVGTCGRASAERQSFTPTASFPTGSVTAPERAVKNRKPFRSSSASPSSMWSSVTACPPRSRPGAPPVELDLILPEAEALIEATAADLRVGGNRAYYDVVSDYVRLPPPQAYFETINWHRTALHELGHWTGAARRLGRDLSGSFGSKKYAFEELIAEMTAAFTCASLGIVPTVRHSDYIGSWLDVMREDNRAVVRAASAASKAANFLLAFRSVAATSESLHPSPPAQSGARA